MKAGTSNVLKANFDLDLPLKGLKLSDLTNNDINSRGLFAVADACGKQQKLPPPEGGLGKLLLELRQVLGQSPAYLHQQTAGGKVNLSPSPLLPLCVLCAGLDNSTKLPSEALRRELQNCHDDVLFCLPKLIEMTISWRNDETANLFVIGSALSVLLRVAEFFPNSIATIGLSVLLVFQTNHLPIDIKVEAACVLVSLLRIDSNLKQHGIVTNLIDANHRLIISVLSTSSMTGSTNQLQKSLGALLTLIQSNFFRRKLVRRRGVVLAVGKQLGNTNQGIRLIALSLCGFFFELNEGDEVSLLENNSAIAARSLNKLLLDEHDQETMLEGIQVAASAISSRTLDTTLKELLMRTLFRISTDASASKETADIAILTYLSSASRAENRFEVLSSAIGLLDSENRDVRRASMNLLKDVSFWTPRSLLQSSLGCLEKLAQVISHGSDEDCTEALLISRQLISERGAAPIFCMQKRLVAAIVDMVTNEPIKNRAAHINSTHIVLALLSDESNMFAFLPFQKLLPWFIDSANRTSDEEMKKQLCSVIIKFTVAKLDEIAPSIEFAMV